jgi:hypothetical protein
VIHLNEIPEILQDIPLERLKRIDLALEGDWNKTVIEVWQRKTGFLGWRQKTLNHPEFKPSLELYFQDSWVGIHCFKRTEDLNVFDWEKGEKIIQFIEDCLNQ